MNNFAFEAKYWLFGFSAKSKQNCVNSGWLNYGIDCIFKSEVLSKRSSEKFKIKTSTIFTFLSLLNLVEHIRG